VVDWLDHITSRTSEVGHAKPETVAATEVLETRAGGVAKRVDEACRWIDEARRRIDVVHRRIDEARRRAEESHRHAGKLRGGFARRLPAAR